MNTDYQHDGEDDGGAARLVAHALGQLNPAEQAAVEAELLASPSARQAFEAARALAARLQESARQDAAPERSAALREAVERRLQELDSLSSPERGRPARSIQQRRPHRRRWTMFLVAAALLLIAAVPTYLFVASQRERQTLALRDESGSQVSGQSKAQAAIAKSEHVLMSRTQSPADEGRDDKLSDEQSSLAEEYKKLEKKLERRSENGRERDGLLHKPSADLVVPEKACEPAAQEKPGEVGQATTQKPSDLSPNILSGHGGLPTTPPTMGPNYSTSKPVWDASKREPSYTVNKPRGETKPEEKSRSGPQYDDIVNAESKLPLSGEGGQREVEGHQRNHDVDKDSGDTGLKAKNKTENRDGKEEQDGQKADKGGDGQPGDQKQPQKNKNVETWKPSGLTPNTSRLMVGENEELPLRAMQVDVRVDGFRARVILDLYYFNDHPRQLEGDFQLRLPQEASPYFFAFGRTVYQAPRIEPEQSMFFRRDQIAKADTTPDQILALRKESWEEPKVARMVPREKAALAYREMVRRQVDPALVEWSGASVFQCRVFPLAPQSLHRVTVGYDVDLLSVGDDLELRLDLPENTPACVVDFNISGADAKQISLDAPATRSADGRRLSYRLTDPKDRPLSVRLRKPGATLLAGSDDKTGGYFAARVAIPELGTGSKETPVSGSKRAVFLVDVSLSAGPQFAVWNKLLQALLDNNRDRVDEFAVLFFNVETFWWQERFVANTPENVAALMAYADKLTLEGATDLGGALREAGSPAWLKKPEGDTPDLFLLSDGAATWGEDCWPALTAVLKAAHSGPVFAYQTGMAGSDPRLLAYLAQETGGAVFSVVGEAEIARASTAHRSLPWRLANVEMSGGRDILVAGRPRFVFPGQQLLVVGRCEPGIDKAEIALTLQRGDAKKLVQAKMDRVLSSELAARTYGQVAVGQLEDLAEAAEPIATSYARHFRVTGRVCSLLMLESEADYARFHIRPEEDDFVVKDRPAAAVVTKTLADSVATLGDPKASFLAWMRNVEQKSGVRFDLPASFGIAVESLPKESFAVAVPPLRCKLHEKQQLPENARSMWASGLPAYETLTEECERRLQKHGADDALRALSSLVEARPGDVAAARDVAFSAMAWGLPGQAYHLLRRSGAGRNFEPTALFAIAHCLEQAGNADDLAVIYYELALCGQWDARFGDVRNIAQCEYARFLRHLVEGRSEAKLVAYAKSRLATLDQARVLDKADLVTLILWNTDGTDVDLHVTEPGGEECFYSHRQTASGGNLSQDVTTGYGPELYILPHARPGLYNVRAHYFAADANRASTRTKVYALIYEGWGTKQEKVTRKAVALFSGKEMHGLADVRIDGPVTEKP